MTRPTPTSARTARSSPATCTRRGPRSTPTATSRPRGGHAVPVPPAAAARRLDAAQLAGQRQARTRLVQHPARRGRLPDPDGAAVRPRRRQHALAAHQGRGQLRARHGPASASERWEEQSGYSPSTIAAEIAGLVAAAPRSPSCTVTPPTRGSGWRPPTSTSAASRTGRSRRPARCPPSRTSSGCPRPATRTPAISYSLGNGGPTLDQRAVIDAGFLELVRLGELLADRPGRRQLAQGRRRDDRATTAERPGLAALQRRRVRRLLRPAAEPAARPTGRAVGTERTRAPGHIWPVLPAERAQQDLATGQAPAAGALLEAINAQASGVGLVPEQVWDEPDVPASPVRDRPDRRLDRLHQRQAGRFGRPADLGCRLLRPADRRPVAPARSLETPGQTTSTAT